VVDGLSAGLAGAMAFSVALASDTDAARLRNFTKTDTALQSGDTNVQGEVAKINVANDPFSFTRVGKIRKITQITITATIRTETLGLASLPRTI
jgi:hypothetical protein